MANGNNTGRRDVKKDSYSVRPNYRSLAAISWSDIDSDIVSSLVVAVTAAGAAVMLSKTSDGGALAITVLDGDSKLKEYPRTETEVSNFVLWLKDEYFVQPTPLKKTV